MAATSPEELPSPDEIDSVFHVYEVRTDEDVVEYYGDPLVPRSDVVETVYPLFRDVDREVTLERRTGEFVLVARPRGSDGFPWWNATLFVATLFTTFYSGTLWYYVFTKHDVAAEPLSLLHALPFAAAVMAVLGTHELGHYVMSRYHDVDASLPYFIPMLPPFGTIGAVIRMRGRMPDRRALFDIGIAGPIAGLVATVAVTAVGLWLPPVSVPQSILQSPGAVELSFSYPPLLRGIAWLIGEPLGYDDPSLVVNPVVIGGWIGMFVTFLNLLPVGQLDGGHVVRALLGPGQRRVARAVPVVLFGLAGYLYLTGVRDSIGVWVLWGLLTAVIARVGPADPVTEGEIDRGRVALAVVVFLLGLLCFTPVPVQISY